jgi:hydroxypyruvate isomerase
MPEHIQMKSPNPSSLSRRQALAGTIAAAAAASLATSAVHAAADEAGSPSSTKGRINQTVCQWCYAKMSVEDLAANAARMGIKGMDLVGPEHWETLRKHNLIGTMTPSHSIPKGLNHKENWDECLGKIRNGVEATADAGFPNVICFSGNRDKMDDEEGLKNCAEALKQVVGLAEQKKVTICMELLNSKVNHKDYMCDHSAWGVKLVKAVGSERFRLLYDIYHMQIMEGDVIATIKRDHQYFAHYHTGGVPGRHEIDETQELYYPAIMQAIVATGYKGWVGQEFIPAREPMASLAQAAKICDV